MSYLVDIKTAILQLDAGSFQNLCDEFLNDCGYSNIVSLGSKPGTTKTTSGTPDTYYCVDESGNYVFIEYTTQQNSIYNKIYEDVKKCLNEGYTHTPCDKITEILYFHTTSNLTPQQDTELKEICKSKGILLRIYGIDYLANELFDKHKYLVKQHLGISIATEQILSYDDFIRNYNKAKTAAPIDTDFRFRTEEITSVINGLDSNEIVLLCGEAGVGKTRLALECCKRYADSNNYTLFCIRNNNLPVYDDLHLFFRNSGNYMILIDDANELTQLETIIKYFNEQKESNYKIILTVRNYAVHDVSATLKSIANIAFQKISPLQDNEMEELLKEEFKITNRLFLDRIIQIAKGNARIALMAGKISADADSLESIKDVTDIYSSYYGKFLSELDLTDKKLYSVAAIAAFIGAIHMDQINEFADIITACGMTIDEFREKLYQLHGEEIIDIYKEKAVKFADQCLSNYLLYCVIIEKKWIKLSEIIRYTFKVNKSQTISSINVLTNLFITKEKQEYIFSEIKELWDVLSSEDPVFFWEYVKTFYLVNPTEALLLVKDKIEKTEQTNMQVGDLKIDSRNKTVDDDCLIILGGLAYNENLETALDLYFLYYQKKPDLINQFYSTAINHFGIDKECYKFDFQIPIRFIEKLIEKTDSWQNIYVDILFTQVANHFLKLHFDGTEGRGIHGIMWYSFDLVSSNGANKYRELLWNGLIEMYSRNIEEEHIEDVLYNYGNPNSENSTDILIKDHPFILNLLTLFENKNSLYFCGILDNLNYIYKHKNIESAEFKTYLNSAAFELYKTFDTQDEFDLRFLESDEILKHNVESYISALNKDEFFYIIDFFCNSKIEVTYYNQKALNFAFEYIIKNKDYFLDALKYYLGEDRKQYPLNPDMQISLMFELYSDHEIWTIISEASDNIRNTWQYYYFCVIPQKYIDEEHLKEWYYFLVDDSDKNILSSGYRDLLFLNKFNSISSDAFINSCKIIMEKRKYSEFIVRIYVEFLLLPTPEKIIETMELFKGNYDLLCQLYLFSLSIRKQNDHQGELLKAIYEKYPKILDLLFDQWENDQQYLSPDETRKLGKLFELDDYEHIFDNIIDSIISRPKIRLYFQEDRFASMLALGNIDKQYADRPDQWIKHYISQYSGDEQRMKKFSEAILSFNEEKRIEYIRLFLSVNKEPKLFRKLRLLPSSSSWIGSEVPIIQKQIDFISSLLPLLNGLDYLNHKKFIEEEITYLKKYMENVEINEILRGI